MSSFRRALKAPSRSSLYVNIIFVRPYKLILIKYKSAKKQCQYSVNIFQKNFVNDENFTKKGMDHHSLKV